MLKKKTRKDTVMLVWLIEMRKPGEGGGQNGGFMRPSFTQVISDAARF